MDSPKSQSEKKVNEPGSGKFTKILLKLVFELMIPLLIIAVALVFFQRQMKTRPKAQRRKTVREARLVTVESMKKGSYPTTIFAMGTVVPSREITINPQVTGLIISMDPVVIPGGLIEENQVLYQIDSQDYLTVLHQRESEVAKANLDLKLELGNQEVAQQEYQMLEQVVDEGDKELVLRKPQLIQAQAALDASKALLDQAKLDLARCTISAPFNAMIIEKYVDIGALVSPSDSLVHIIGTDEYWIEVSIPEDQLQWVHIPEFNEKNGSSVRIYNPTAWGSDVYLEGHVIRLMGQLEDQGRMARLIVSLKDPLALDDNSSHPPLLISSYVRVEIEGPVLKDVFAVPREYLHNGNNIWIMNSENKLEIRQVKIKFSAKERVYIREGIKPGEKIVTTNIPAPVDQMPLRTNNNISE